MSRKRWAIMGLAGVTLATGVWATLGKGKAKAGEPKQDGDSGRQAVELTVYKDDFGMVRETRPVSLISGDNRLHLPNVSKSLDPQSVLLQWQDKGASLPDLTANAYDLGVTDSASLAKRYLGQEVEVVRYGDNGHEAERQKGTLMVADGDQIVLQSEGKLFVHPSGTLVAPINGNLITIPQLSVQARSSQAQNANLGVTYLTRGLAWSADYVATLAPNANRMELQCWATVTNRTGVDYPNAKVSLVAGSPNRAVVEAEDRAKTLSRDYEGYAVNGAAKMPAPKPDAFSVRFQPTQNVGEFHAYPVKEPTTVVQEQMNRLEILSSQNVPVTRDYSARPPELSYWDDSLWGTRARPGRGTVGVSLSFANRQKDGLGILLPGGAVRLYEPDGSGTLRYAGAASVEDTPNDGHINMTLAQAFDLYTDWRLVKKQKINKKTTRKSVELTIHNAKDIPSTVRVIQSFGGRGKIVSESAKHTNLDASAVQYKITVPAKGATTLHYAADVSA